MSSAKDTELSPADSGHCLIVLEWFEVIMIVDFHNGFVIGVSTFIGVVILFITVICLRRSSSLHKCVSKGVESYFAPARVRSVHFDQIVRYSTERGVTGEESISIRAQGSSHSQQEERVGIFPMSRE